MVILQSLKRQLNQFVTPEFENVIEESLLQPTQRTSSLTLKNLPVKNAYSHGLEEIYALESVDPKTIRRLGDVDPKTPNEIPNKPLKREYYLSPNHQLELCLGPAHASYMPSFVLNLPLDVLKLSEGACSIAIQRGYRYVRDLIPSDWEESMLARGIGRGTVEEIKKALKLYIGNRELLRCQSVDFEALLRSVISKELVIKHYLNLEQYNLGHIIDLSPIMHIELKRASPEAKARWIEESHSALRMVDNLELIRSSLKQVILTFLSPWLRRRNGFTYSYEAMDRLQQISAKPEFFENIAKCLSHIFCDHKSLAVAFLPTDDESSLVFIDNEEKERFTEVEERALSYFYKPDVRYTLRELVAWVYRELAVSWKSYDSAYIERVIRHSPRLKWRKISGGELIVAIA